MWKQLKKDQKDYYKKLITNFASLSEVFSQKTEGDDEDIAPIVNSKFQETVFQRSFGATGEDIANTSYDASLIVDEDHKYLIGIKSFGFNSGDQKIAQFKYNSQSDDWGIILSKIKENALNNYSSEELKKINEPLYKELTLKIAELRNERIASSKAIIKGFNAINDNIKSVYHVLMPTKKGESPYIYVGEIDYSPIDIENIQILGATTKNKITNFKFTDGKHKYKYTSADSQLLMNFENKNIVLDKWKINYIDNPIKVFESINSEEESKAKLDYEMSVSWSIPDESGKIHMKSGYNSFNSGIKMGKEQRERTIRKFENIYKNSIDYHEYIYILSKLKLLLKTSTTTQVDKIDFHILRKELTDYIQTINNKELEEFVNKILYSRSKNEMYIPIPDSYKFHSNYPNFFGENIGKFKEKQKLLLNSNDRVFRLEFLPSGDAIKAYINQQAGKAIQSIGNQDILGQWILREVFRLKPDEILTSQKLNEIGINGLRLYKFNDKNRGIGLEFIWIDPNNPPTDAIGWISKIKTTESN